MESLQSQNYIKKKDSQFLYGVAIILMIYHHLFSDYVRLGVVPVSIFGNFQIRIAWFCKICVAMYAFISGYGIATVLSKRHEKRDKKLHDCICRWIESVKYVTQHLMVFMIKYWIVFVCFIPLGVFLGVDMSYKLETIILSFLGRTNVYNGEWWYVRQYQTMLLALPCIDLFFYMVENLLSEMKKIYVYGFMILCGGLTVQCLFPGGITALFELINSSNVYTYMLIFIEGYTCSRCDSELFNIIKIKSNFDKYIASILILLVFAVRIFLQTNASYKAIDLWVIAPFIYALVTISHSFSQRERKTIGELGKYSTYMWLTHTFFCFYYFNSLITISKFSIIIYLETFLLSLGSALILERIEVFLVKYLKKLR